MRLRTALALGVAAAAIPPAVIAPVAAAPAVAASAGVASGDVASAAVASAAVVPAALAPAPGPAPAPSRPPACGDPRSREFPLRTAIRGGPDTYAPGGGFQTWELELSNATREECRGIHPVVVLTDRDRVLRAAHVQMEFFDAEAGRRRSATVEETDHDETIGVFEGEADFPGFTVAPGTTLTVEVRLAFTAEAQPNEVVAEAAAVQRQGDDGEWVGDSRDYRFTIAADSGGKESAGPPVDESEDESTDESADAYAGSSGDDFGDGFGDDVGDELARTGTDAGTAPGANLDRLRGLGLAAGGLVLGGVALVVGSRRLRRR